MADCGLRQVGALTGLGQIADCISGTLRWAAPNHQKQTTKTAFASYGLQSTIRAIRNLSDPSLL
eukprot:7707568-Alexandrium_andersonii.AAC.1